MSRSAFRTTVVSANSSTFSAAYETALLPAHYSTIVNTFFTAVITTFVTNIATDETAITTTNISAKWPTHSLSNKSAHTKTIHTYQSTDMPSINSSNSSPDVVSIHATIITALYTTYTPTIEYSIEYSN